MLLEKLSGKLRTATLIFQSTVLNRLAPIGELKKTFALLRSYPVDKLELKSVNYDDYWRDKRKNCLGLLTDFQRNRANIVATMIDDGASVLDLGCGDGAILAYLRNKKGIVGIGVDTSKVALDHLSSQGFTTIQLELDNFSNLESLPEVDYVMALEVIEHMPNPEQFLSILESKCRKAFILSIPNTGYYIHRLRLLFGHFPMQWRLHPGEHLRFWTVADLKWWVKAIGRDLSELCLYKGLPGLNKLFPSWFAQGMVIKINNENVFKKSREQQEIVK